MSASLPMTKLDWNKSFSVNIKKFDQHHKILFTYVSQLGKSAMSKDNEEREIIGQTLDKLVGHIMNHFLDEEVEMYGQQYPDFERHKKAHDLFLSKVRSFTIILRADKSSVLLNCELVAFLTEWITDHLRDMDMEYSPYLNSKGIY